MSLTQHDSTAPKPKSMSQIKQTLWFIKQEKFTKLLSNMCKNDNNLHSCPETLILIGTVFSYGLRKMSYRFVVFEQSKIADGSTGASQPVRLSLIFYSEFWYPIKKSVAICVDFIQMLIQLINIYSTNCTKPLINRTLTGLKQPVEFKQSNCINLIKRLL